MLITVVEVIGALALLVMVSVSALAVWSRRGDRAPDLPGTRTIATFQGGASYDSVSDREREPDAPRGEGLMEALAVELRKLGISVGHIEGHVSVAWGAYVESGTAKAYLTLGECGDARGGGAEQEWLLSVEDPGSRGPGPRSLLGDIDAALKCLTDLRGVRWDPRQSSRLGESHSAAASPLDE